MGQYCDLFVSNILLTSTRNDVDPRIRDLFTNDELIAYKRKYKDRINFDPKRDYGEETEFAVEYKSNCKIIRDRLNIFGFNSYSAEKDFLIGKDEKIKSLKSFYTAFPDFDYIKEIKKDIRILESASYQDFLQAAAESINAESLSNIKSKHSNAIIYYLSKEKGLSNFPQTDDPRFLISTILSLFDDGTPVVYDLSEFIDAQDDTVQIDEIIEDVDYYSVELEKFLVLAEGSNDIEIIRNSMMILYPHLLSYYSFMDFGVSNASGSAGSLVATIKSFIGAGIKNKTIAIFDNDTAAEVAIRGLKKSQLPPNIKILKYPNTELAQNYPTLGPTGAANMNINGTACSIELYLGRDTLLHNGKFIPIQWKGLDPSIGKYQGEITEKSKVQKMFQAKIRKCTSNRDLIKNYDWTELDAILQNIFNAFNK